MRAVIMAGGKGTRIAPVANDIPKPMICIGGKPILELQLEVLKKQGIREVIIVIGYLGGIIQKYFRDGKAFNMNIRYIIEEKPLGSAGALSFFHECPDDILLINGDIVFDIDINRFYEWHRKKHANITLFTHPNDHPFDSTLVEADECGKVLRIIRKEDKRYDYKNRVNAGLHLLSPEVLKLFPAEPVKMDLDRDIVQKHVRSNLVFAYDSPEYVKDMGTPERYFLVCEDYVNERVKKRNLKLKQKAVFLDRDGTVNVYKGYINDPDQIELIPEVGSAIKRLNESEYLVVIVTNQPVIARGECTFEQMTAIHNRMERLLGESGAYIDGIFMCPHHPDKGFEGEIKELKIKCTCRKPQPGMLLQAAEKYNIDLCQSYMVGDHEWDMLAGKAAGCRVILADHGLDNRIVDQILQVRALKGVQR